MDINNIEKSSLFETYTRDELNNIKMKLNSDKEKNTFNNSENQNIKMKLINKQEKQSVLVHNIQNSIKPDFNQNNFISKTFNKKDAYKQVKCCFTGEKEKFYKSDNVNFKNKNANAKYLNHKEQEDIDNILKEKIMNITQNTRYFNY